MKIRHIYNNYDLCDRVDETKQFIMDEHPDLCDVEVETNGVISMEPSETCIWDFIYSQDGFDWEACRDELLNFFGNKDMIMFGSTGRWNGNFSGFTVGTFEELFHDIIKDCDYISIYDDNGHFYIDCSHHDGNNHVELKELSKRGYDLYDNWMYDYTAVGNKSESYIGKLLSGNNFYSKLPHYAKHVFG